MLETTAEVSCPHCGETITLFLDLTVETQSDIEDCSVCCQPMTVSYAASGGELERLDVEAACATPMWRKLRIFVLLLVLMVVGLNTYFDRVYSTDWDIPLRIGIYAINADDSAAAARHIAALQPQV